MWMKEYFHAESTCNEFELDMSMNHGTKRKRLLMRNMRNIIVEYQLIMVHARPISTNIAPISPLPLRLFVLSLRR